MICENVEMRGETSDRSKLAAMKEGSITIRAGKIVERDDFNRELVKAMRHGVITITAGKYVERVDMSPERVHETG